MRWSARSTRLPVALALSAALMAPARPLVAAPAAGDSTAVLDSARAEMAVGRNWHAAALLAPLRKEGGLDRAGLVLLARAEAGYRNWTGVRTVLEEVAATGDLDGPTWQLLGRAREAVDAPGPAAEAYRRALAGGLPTAEARVTRLRLARVQWSADHRTEALAVLDSVEVPGPRSWLALELLAPAIDRGDTAVVRTLLSRITAPTPLDLAWDATARSRWEAGDSVGAAEAYRAVLAGSPTDARKAPAWRVIGEVALAGGDSAAARSAFEEAVVASPYGRSGGIAARHLVDLGGLTASMALTAARSLDRLGDGARALKAYDRYVARSEAAGEEPAPAARVERARIMATVRDRQEEAIGEYRELSTSPDPDVGSRALVLWAGLRRRQGRTGDEATIRRWLVERYPNTPAAADVVFFRGDAAHDRQDLSKALEEYGRVAEMAPALDRAGLARMRMGMILLEKGRVAEAAKVYEGYLAAFPSGRRWEEATYWAARTRLGAGRFGPGGDVSEAPSGRGAVLLLRHAHRGPAGSALRGGRPAGRTGAGGSRTGCRPPWTSSTSSGRPDWMPAPRMPRTPSWPAGDGKGTPCS